MTSRKLPKAYLYRRIVLAKLFMDGNFQNSIDLTTIAGEAFYSKFHFIKLFKSVYKKTPHQYLTFVRIEKAKVLLQTEMSVADVCFSVGFDDTSTFTKLFKRMVDVTPSTYHHQECIRRADMKSNPLRFIPTCFAEQNGWVKNRNFQPLK